MILLAKIDILELFILNFPLKVLIPEKVKMEVCIKGREETPLIIKLIEIGSIIVVKVKKNQMVKKLMEDFNIGEGEAEVLALAIQKKISLIASDDRNAIKACKILKIDFITAISALIRALEKGLIDKENAIAKLYKLASVGRYSRTIVDKAMKQIEGGK